ncbi:MAG: transcription-repair coupling factor, partial [Enterobacterales bacterium]|nr:transcription-repair coupling factor [Enterobacterales bacterium]
AIHPVDDWQQAQNESLQMSICVGHLHAGFYLADQQIALIGENLLFGQRQTQQQQQAESSIDADAIIKNLAELRIGDAVVHAEHGVGRYLGLVTLTTDSIVAEYLNLEYADGDKLYVPDQMLHLIGRYTGAGKDSTPLHRLGSEQWSKAKQRAAKRARDVAAELLDIYARRAAKPGLAYRIPENDYSRFCAEFPFQTTQDQENAIQAMLKDLQADRPMDRLVCGDVGFGKTEVALRAAFIVTQNLKQVAVLVPTTLLAQQHYESFTDRFADWPINIAVLSRFRTAKEQTAILKDVANGKIDILIGTHKLLSKELHFERLGLVVVDEEHRFGVNQKEKIKQLRSEVDVLTLTATPIPRTLNMSFAGIRDLSIIASPPARRLAIKTFVREYNKPLIREAILREIHRGGQVYFLHNDVASIDKTAKMLGELIPEARIGVGHGQMREKELERLMQEFYHQRFNVLVSTTIIETGIDVPSANTIIIERADKFGLAQLHQLRGRVGRSHHQAYAFLLTPHRNQMTKDAHKRLEAIETYTDLGAGFILATQDMEIRGAGELLGDEQSGQIQSIGFSLYMELLDSAVQALKEGKEPSLRQSLSNKTEIDLGEAALIPDDYIADVGMRLSFYKRIANAKSGKALDALQVELIDRFGLLPDVCKNLFSISLLKLTTTQYGMLNIQMDDESGSIEFQADAPIEPISLIQLMQSGFLQAKMRGAAKLHFEHQAELTTDKVQVIMSICDKLQLNTN